MNNNTDINKTLQTFVSYPKYPLYNFQLAYAYEIHGHNASAFSFYLRAAELSTDDLFCYECLLRMSFCLEKLGNRVHSLKGIILRAFSLLPKRPEALFMLARINEQNKDWHEAYSYACLGEQLEFPEDKLITNVDFPGKYGFTFERAVSAWWIGLYDESIHLFRQLDKMPWIEEKYAIATRNNINKLGYLWKRELRYNDSMYHELRYKFPGSEKMIENFSQCFQDMFILMMLNGKRNGKFLEIGCGDPFYSNNTVTLERQFGWYGISVDVKQDVIDKYREHRKGAMAICMDARLIPYDDVLEEGDYDFLQLDCEPAIITFDVLQKIPLHKHRFAVITFEHDNFCDENSEIKERSRKYLRSFGYEMVVNNIAEDRFSDYEDWWVHPDLVRREIIDLMKCISDKPKRADLYILGKIT